MHWRRRICQAIDAREIRVAQDEPERQRFGRARKGAFGAMGTLAPNYYVQDGVVPRSQLPEMMRRIAAISQQFNLTHCQCLSCRRRQSASQHSFRHARAGRARPGHRSGRRHLARLRRTRRQHHRRARRRPGEEGLHRSCCSALMTSKRWRACAGRSIPNSRFNPAKLFPAPASCGEVRLQPAQIPAGLWI